MGQAEQLLLLPTKVGSGLQVEFDDNKRGKTKNIRALRNNLIIKNKEGTELTKISKKLENIRQSNPDF